ncbi:MAG: hypothetical protein KC729_21420, partial [Candidatus Eisenbacteria bacterium]|nr:hypothetical protein [Candidatus Eisenbacteria bacterium]
MDQTVRIPGSFRRRFSTLAAHSLTTGAVLATGFVRANEFFVTVGLLLSAGLVASPATAQISDNVTLRGTLNQYPNTWYSGIWGYSAPNGVELAIVGQRGGTSFVNVTDPANPVEVLYLSGDTTTWREIKTYDHYAYQVCDDCDDGLNIVDLSDPLHPVPLPPITTWFGSSHTIWIDQEQRLLFCNGTNTHQGCQIFDLSVSPTNPPRIYT